MTHTAHTSPQRLRRNTSEGKIAGVAAGIGDYVGIDPVVIRLLFVLLVFAGGFGALAYLIAWLVIPPLDESEPIAPGLQRRLPGSRWNWRAIIGGLALTVGLFAFLGSAGAWWLPDIEAWPIILVVIGAGLLLLRRRDRGDGPPAERSQEHGSPEGPTTAAHAGDSSGSAPAESSERDDPPSETEAVSDHVSDTGGAGDQITDETTQELVTSQPGPAPPPVEPPPAPRPRRKRLPVGWATLGVVLAGAAVAGLLSALGVVDVSVQVFLIAALVATGIGLVASAFVGRPLGLVFLTVVVAAVLGLATLVDNVSLRSGAGDRTVRLASVSELDDRYELSAGKLTLDLRELDLAGEEATLEVGVGVGELVLILPPDVNAEIAGRASIGEIELFGRTEGGVSVEQTARLSAITRGRISRGASAGLYAPAGLARLAASPGRLIVDADVGIGKLEARLAS